MRRRIPPLAALPVLAAAMLVGGCGAKRDILTTSSTEPLRVMLDYTPNPDHAGLYDAIATGKFKQAGLAVKPLTPPDPASPLKLLAAGRVDLAISYEPELLLARDKGARLVAVGAIVQKPLTSLVSLPAGKVRTPADLAGKTVGTAGIPYQSAYLKTILAAAHVPADSVREVNVGFNLVPAMLSKRVDATLGAFWNVEGVSLDRARRRPSIIRMDQAGVPPYDELVLVARQADLAKGGSKIRRFVQALGRGYADVRADPKPAENALLGANPDLDKRETAASIRATLPAFLPPSRKPFGYQDPRQWDAYGRWMLRNRLLTRPPSASAALSNEFLAGQGA